MLEKTMKGVLKRKIDHWLNTITDKELVNDIKRDLIITGGCITSFILNEKPNDYDCYFTTKETLLKVMTYYANSFNLEKGQTIAEVKPNSHGGYSIFIQSSGVAGEELPKEEIENQIDDFFISDLEEKPEPKKDTYRPVFLTSNAISLSDGIQIITRFYGNPEEIHKNFDFEHTKAYYSYRLWKLEIPKRVWECTINKTLYYSGSLYPICSMFRVRKFLNRGWSINAGQILKMSLQISELDLTNIELLKDQLVGVDSAYFMAIIKEITKRQNKDSDFKLDTSYIAEIVNRIFG